MPQVDKDLENIKFELIDKLEKLVERSQSLLDEAHKLSVTDPGEFIMSYMDLLQKSLEGRAELREEIENG